METQSFVIRTLEEADQLANQLAQACPNPTKAVIGLSELLFNAVEHGMLGISYDEKSHLMETNTWDDEINRRLHLPENAHKTVTVQTWRTGNALHFLIQDQGPGFDWHPFMVIDPARVMHSHGRGIAWANTSSLDHLEYRGAGNEVLAIIRLHDGEVLQAVAP